MAHASDTGSIITPEGQGETDVGAESGRRRMRVQWMSRTRE